MRILIAPLVRALVGIFLLLGSQNLGVQLLPLIAGLGVVAAGIALAMPGVLSNMEAGLTIIFTKPNRVGENIAVLGVEGEVVVISLFNTDLAHPDRSRIVVPNRKVMGEILQNFGKLRQCKIFFWIAYESDLNRALSAVREVVNGNSLVLTDPTAVIQICSLGDSAVPVVLKPWVAVRHYGTVQGDLYLSIAEDLRRYGIVIPYPQTEVRLLSDAA